MRGAALRASVVVLITKSDDPRRITRRVTSTAPTSDGRVIARAAIELLAGVAVEPRKGARVRLCGVSATGLERRDGPRQLGFAEVAREKGERLGDVLDR